jgi:hypothetical protein
MMNATESKMSKLEMIGEVVAAIAVVTFPIALLFLGTALGY